MVGDPNSPNCETGHWTMGPGVGSATGNTGDNGYVGCACQDPEGSIDLSSLGHGADPTGGLFDQWVVVDCACGMQTGGTGWCNEGGYTTGCDLLWVGSPGCEDCNDPEAPSYCDETGMGPGPDGPCAADGNLQWGQAGLWLPPAPWAPTAFGYGAINGPIVFGSAPTNSGCIPCDCQPTVQGGDGCDHCDYYPECLNANGVPYASIDAATKDCLCDPDSCTSTTAVPATTTTPDPCDFSQIGATANGSDDEEWFIIDASLCPGKLCVDFEAYNVPDWIGIFTSANNNHSVDPSDVALLNHAPTGNPHVVFGGGYLPACAPMQVTTISRLHRLFNIPAGIQFVKIVINYGGNCTGWGTAWLLKYQAGPTAANICPTTTTTTTTTTAVPSGCCPPPESFWKAYTCVYVDNGTSVPCHEAEAPDIPESSIIYLCSPTNAQYVDQNNVTRSLYAQDYVMIQNCDDLSQYDCVQIQAVEPNGDNFSAQTQKWKVIALSAWAHTSGETPNGCCCT